MKKLIAAAILGSVASASYSLEQGNALSCEKCERTISMDLWEFMEGYEYEYAKGCVVGWHSRTSTLMYSGSASCPDVSLEKMTRDALQSVDYVKKNTNYKNFADYFYETKYKKLMQQDYSVQQSRLDARKLWNRACIGAKSFKFVSTETMADEFPHLEKIHVIRLVGSANNIVKGLGGVLNCAEQGAYIVDAYTSDIDIRKN